MKIFQVLDGKCHWNATDKHPTLESTNGRYSSEIVFVEAPDVVCEGWLFDDTKIGDERFTPQEG